MNKLRALAELAGSVQVVSPGELPMAYGNEEPPGIDEMAWKTRKNIPLKDFVFPDRRAWPIHNVSHGKTAIDFIVKKRGNPEDWPKVKQAVLSRYPELKDYAKSRLGESDVWLSNLDLLRESMPGKEWSLPVMMLDESIREPAVSKDLAARIGAILGVDFDRVDIEQFRLGLETEFEHGAIDPETDVTNDDLLATAKIALAHIKEVPDYYDKLDNAELTDRGRGES